MSRGITKKTELELFTLFETFGGLYSNPYEVFSDAALRDYSKQFFDEWKKAHDEYSKILELRNQFGKILDNYTTSFIATSIKQEAVRKKAQVKLSKNN